jgi:PAS domain S-box-containing protein
VLHVLGLARDVTDLNEARRQNLALTETSPDLIARFGPDARYLRVNNAMAAAMGVPAHKFVGRNIGEVFSEKLGPRCLEHLLALRETVLQVVATGAVADLELKLPRYAGDCTFDVLLTPELDPTGAVLSVLLVGRDISEAKRVEETLRESERRFRQVTESIDEVFWLTDTTKRQLIYLSPAYERIWGRTCASVFAVPESWMDAIHPEDQDRVRTAALTLQKSGAYDLEYRIVRPDGTVRWIHDRAFPIEDEDGRVHRIAGVAEDTTARRQLEEQVRQTQKMEAVGRLAGGVAHDFNNLLTAIMGYAQLMRMRLTSDDRSLHDIQEILKASTRAAILTRQLLTFSREEMGQPRVLDLGAIVKEMRDLLRPLVGEKVSIVMRSRPDLGGVKADPGQVEQVLLNLVVNARDAMPAGGRVTIETENVDLGTSHAGGHAGIEPGAYVLLAVSDTGIGMDEQTKARIFEPFFTTKPPEKGTGLGLSTVYGIVQQSGGRIQVHSDPASGTTFKIYFPRVAGKTEEAAVADSPEPTPRGTETVLIVEDQDSVAAVVRGSLQMCGYRVLEARHGAEALQLWQEHSASIDLIVTDVVMPVMNGPEFVRRARATRPEVKVLYMSGYTEQGFSALDLLNPDDGFLPKPFVPSALTRKVREVLDSDDSLAK